MLLESPGSFYGGLMMGDLELVEAVSRFRNRRFWLINECAVTGFETDTRRDPRSDAFDFMLLDHNSEEVEASSGLHVSQILLNEGSGGYVRSFLRTI